MKKKLLIAGAVLLATSSVVFGMNATEEKSSCASTEQCVCKPDCKPGDQQCCPQGCED